MSDPIAMKLDASLMFEPSVIAQMAVALEQAGFDGGYTFEGTSDPFTGLILAAPQTKAMELFTSIAVAFARNPMNIAVTGRDLQVLSKGRFALGLGSQVKGHIERRYSMPWSKPAARMKEFVQAVRHIWQCWETETPLSFEGEFYRHTLNSPVFTPPPSGLPTPPIYVAAVGPLMTQMAGEVADGVFIHPFNTAESLSTLVLPNLRSGAEKVGRTDNCKISVQVITATGLTEAAIGDARVAARRQIAFYASTPSYRPVLDVHGWGDLQPLLAGLVRDGRWADMPGQITDEMLSCFAVVGSPDQVAEQIVKRCAGKVDRVSPVIYKPDLEVLTAISQAMHAAGVGSASSA